MLFGGLNPNRILIDFLGALELAVTRFLEAETYVRVRHEPCSVDHIVSIEFLAIMKFHALSQFELDSGVVDILPGLRQARHDFALV